MENAEIWRDIAGTNGRYRVSSLGEIVGPRNAALKRCFDSRGYPIIKYRVDGVGVCRNVHAIVAEAFLGPRPDGHDIDHIDFDVQNAAASNLRYITVFENRSRSSRGARNRHAKLTEDQVREILRLPRPPKGRKAGNHSSDTLAAIAARYGVASNTIHDIFAGKKWAHLSASRGCPPFAQPET